MTELYTIEDILFDAEHNLGIKPAKESKKKQGLPSDVVSETFEDINKFYETKHRLPREDSSDSEEKRLALRFRGFCERSELAQRVKNLDRYHLLERYLDCFDFAPKIEHKEVTEGLNEKKVAFDSLEELLADSSVNDLLGEGDSEIFEMKHVGRYQKPAEIGQRKPCEDFFRFEALFAQKHRDLASGASKAIKYQNGDQIKVGDFYILKGSLCYVAEELEEYNTRRGIKDLGIRYDSRARIIFENGMESNMLKRSLAKELYVDPTGRQVSATAEEATAQLVRAKKNVAESDKDIRTGWIYILATESQNVALEKWKNTNRLVKIGFTTQETVQQRIADAKNDPTYLEAPVKVLAEIECFNMNPKSFEGLVHTYLHERQLPVKLISKSGEVYRPKEWYTIDVQTALDVCRHILARDLHKYRFDSVNGVLVLR